MPYFDISTPYLLVQLRRWDKRRLAHQIGTLGATLPFRSPCPLSCSAGHWCPMLHRLFPLRTLVEIDFYINFTLPWLHSRVGWCRLEEYPMFTWSNAGLRVRWFWGWFDLKLKSDLLLMRQGGLGRAPSDMARWSCDLYYCTGLVHVPKRFNTSNLVCLRVVCACLQRFETTGRQFEITW